MSIWGLPRTRKIVTHWSKYRQLVAAAYDIREKTEKIWVAKLEEERAEGTSYCCLQ